MKKIRKVLYRFRLITSFLALVLLLGALVVTPVGADDSIAIEAGETCENGCVGWDVINGCTRCQRCCVKDTGEWKCWIVDKGLCP